MRKENALYACLTRLQALLLSWVSSKMWFGSGEDCALLGLLDWSRPKESTIVFSVVLVFLLAVRYVSLLSVIGNLSLALISATMAFRIYKSVLAAVNKSGEGNPFKVMVKRQLYVH